MTLTLRDYEGQQWSLNKIQEDFFNKMSEELGMNITVIHGKGARQERPEGIEGIVFFDYATNSESPTPRRIDAISRRNGTQVKLENHFLLKPDDKREHIFDFNNFPLCEMRMFTLWGLTPLNNFTTTDLMQEFWADALRMSCNEEFFRAKEEEKQRQIREAFMSAMKASNQGEVVTQVGVITEQSSRLAQLNADLVSVQTELLRAEQRLEIAKKLAEGDEEAYEQDITSLLKHSQIKKIDWDPATKTLQVYTHLIYMYSPNRKERVPLGEFMIKMDTTRNNVVTLHNLTNQRANKMHPHVEANGSACWGPIGTQVSRLAASCRIEGLADLCIRYLETYNVQDGNAQHARLWFVEKDTQRQRPEFDNAWMTDTELKERKTQEKEKKDKTLVKVPEEKLEVKEEKLTVKDLKGIKA